jgi:hypothetical protein
MIHLLDFHQLPQPSLTTTQRIDRACALGIMEAAAKAAQPVTEAEALVTLREIFKEQAT